MKKLVFSMLLFAGVITVDKALGAVVCAGKVNTLALGPGSGMLQANIGHGTLYLCRFNETTNGVHPETCKAWYSMFLTAKVSGKKISMNFDTTKQCSEIGNWSTPDPMPYWVEIKD